jgi:effector-binding domain-containing protein
VVVREVPSQLTAAIRQAVPDLGDPITQLFDEIETYIAAYGTRAFSSPLTIYHDLEYREENLDVEVVVPLSRSIPANERILIREMPGATMACVVYTGSYDKSTEVLHALLVWIQTHNYTIAGPMREVYLRFGADDAEALRLPEAFLTDNRQLYVTELQLPITNHQ